MQKWHITYTGISILDPLQCTEMFLMV